jgi:endonuclease YncB( thermonuclease family)
MSHGRKTELAAESSTMKSLIAFWKKDIINKLIIIVLLGLAGMVFVFGWLIFNMPQGRSFSEAFADFLPRQATPTFDINIYLTPATNTPAAPTATRFPVFQPTSTLPPPTPKVELPTPTLEVPTPTLQPPTQIASNRSTCIPNNPRQTGKVVEVLDGNTVRALLRDNGLIYVVRYIGVAAPVDNIYSVAAEQKNTQLVYGKEIVLIKDVNDKDDRGRLLRYVLVGDMFVNLEIIQQGLGAVLDVPPDSACAQVFKQAEKAAGTSMLGIWSPTTTPKSP